MRQFSLLLGSITLYSLAMLPASAQLEIDTPFEIVLPGDPYELPNPRLVDLGDIASDGLGGRQNQVRPLEPDDVGREWKFFPPHLQLPEVFPEPTPATPSQQSILLREGLPLVFVIPQLAHYPFGAKIDVEHQRSGSEITIQASIHHLSYSTATIYGPHEYLLPLGTLDSGEYHITFDLSHTSDYSNQVTLLSGFMEFTVHPIPEPSSAVLGSLSAVCLGWTLRSK